MSKRGPKTRRKLPIADPLAGGPDKPDWLSPEASAEWDRLLAMLLERRTISRADGAMLAMLCSTYAAWRTAIAAEAKVGAVTETATGGFKQSPESLAANQLGKLLITMLREFGLTPASRHHVAPIIDIARDDLGVFLGEEMTKFDGPLASKIRLLPPTRKGG
jgi:P27 family predicted phage terminase small subunit